MLALDDTEGGNNEEDHEAENQSAGENAEGDPGAESQPDGESPEGDHGAAALTLFAIDGIEGLIDHEVKTVAVALPEGTDVTALVATFEATGKVQVANRNQTSGETANDFTAPKNYKVIADGGEAVTYTVTVVLV